MPTGNNIVRFALAALAAVVFGVLLARKCYNVIVISMGAMLVLIGVSGLLAGKLWQRHNAAPPLTGSGAMVACIFLIVGGLAVVGVSLRRKPTGVGHRAAPFVPPKGGPAEPPSSASVGGGPPSVS